MAAENTATTQTQENAANQATLKLIENRAHYGPTRSKMRISKGELSKAVGKIIMTNDLKVTLKGEDNSSPNKMNLSQNPSSSTEVVLIRFQGGTDAIKAAYTFAAWDLMYNGVGTPEYLEKEILLHKAQGQAYRELGIIIDPNSKIKPELTEAQRVKYGEMVRPYSFDYFEVKLSFKTPGKKVVRSKTFRFLDHQDLNRFKDNLLKTTSETVCNKIIIAHK